MKKKVDWSEVAYKGWATIRSRKAKILRLARSGKDKPSQDTELGRVLALYYGNRLYGKAFWDTVESIRPEWSK